MSFLDRFLFRLVYFLIFAATLSVTYPYASNFFNFESARIEISGLKPQEKIVIERNTLMFLTLETTADEKGVAVFYNVTLGNWRVAKGGTKELQKMVISVKEGRDNNCGSIRSFWKISWKAIGGCSYNQGPVKVSFH